MTELDIFRKVSNPLHKFLTDPVESMRIEKYTVSGKCYEDPDRVEVVVKLQNGQRLTIAVEEAE